MPVEFVLSIIGMVLILLVGWALFALLKRLKTSTTFRYWFIWYGLVPLLSICLAIYVALTPQPVRLDYQEGVHADTGRLDFVLMMFFGVALPVLYLLVMLPIAAVIWLVRMRK